MCVFVLPIGWLWAHKNIFEKWSAKATFHCRTFKSLGLDGVHAWMVVCGGQAAKGALVALYQNVWSSGKLPKAFHEARISYLHKKGRKTEVSNYRPISLISVMAKTFTRSWVGRLQTMAADHLVTEQGCGQKGQGAPEHLWAFIDLMEEGMVGGGWGNTWGLCPVCRCGKGL